LQAGGSSDDEDWASGAKKGGKGGKGAKGGGKVCAFDLEYSLTRGR